MPVLPNLSVYTQAVGYDEGGAAGHEGVHAALDELLGAGVYRARGLVENEHGGIGDRGAGDGEQLALALAEVCAVAGEHGVVPSGRRRMKPSAFASVAAAMHSSSVASRLP